MKTISVLAISAAAMMLTSAMAGPLEEALQAGDLEEALQIAEADLDAAPRNSEASGLAAFQAARIAEAIPEPLKAAKHYDTCADSYAALGQMPQASDCRYRAGLAWRTAGKPGTAESTLAKGLKELERSGNADTPATVTIAIALAEMYAPNDRFARDSESRDRRRRAIRTVEKAKEALVALGHEQSSFMADAYLIEARMYDDLWENEPARAAYDRAAEIYSALGPDYADSLEDTQMRISALEFESGKRDNSTVTVERKDGAEVTLKIKRRRHVSTPRRDDDFTTDGARGTVLITLDEDGNVASANILESVPDPAYGEAVKEAVLTWHFTAEDGTSPEEIAPFPYTTIFYLTQRGR